MSPGAESLSPRSQALLAGIRSELARILEEARWSTFERCGGRFDPSLSTEALVRALGPRRAAAMTHRYVELTREARRLYLLRPQLVFEHFRLSRELARGGFLRRREPDGR
jgi:hypothetical protein